MMVVPSAYHGRSPGGRAHRTGTRADLTHANWKGPPISESMAAKGIARVPGISMHTRRGHLKSVHSKLGFPANANDHQNPATRPDRSRRTRSRTLLSGVHRACWSMILQFRTDDGMIGRVADRLRMRVLVGSGWSVLDDRGAAPIGSDCSRGAEL